MIYHMHYTDILVHLRQTKVDNGTQYFERLLNANYNVLPNCCLLSANQEQFMNTVCENGLILWGTYNPQTDESKK